MTKLTTILILLVAILITSCACQEVELNTDQQEYLDLINNVRTSHNLQVVQPVQKLNNLAQSRCNDMLTRNYFSHITPEGHRVSCGEILAKGKAEPEMILQCWLDSPTHKEVILYPDYKYIGIWVEGGIITILFSSR